MTVTWAPAALDDLIDVYTYIADDSPERAEGVVRAVTRTAEGLADFPLLGRVGALLGTREQIMSRYRYKIVYRIGGEEVEIVRIIHTSRNWP